MMERWHSQGYKVGLLIGPPLLKHMDFPGAERVIEQPEWLGFPLAANILCHEVPGDIVVVVGDDVYPDPDRTAQEIGEDFLKRFPDTYGVMQPLGDRFANTHLCAVSPWIGRGFIERAYDGIGPFWSQYFHYFSDQELQEYAIKQNAFWQREDLTQYHDHWQRQASPKRPKHLRKAKRLHKRDQALFKSRQERGFPCGIDK